jgi:hypothetical protein
MTRWITNSGPILWAETALATSGAGSATWAVVIDTLYILTDTLYTQGSGFDSNERNQGKQGATLC